MSSGLLPMGLEGWDPYPFGLELPAVTVGITATYDLTTLIGEVRLYCQDTNVSDPAFSDAELNVFLTRCSGNVFHAAAMACDVMAGDFARAAKVIKIGTDSVDRRSIPEEMRKTAAMLRTMAPVAIVVNAPDAIFTMTSDEGATLGTLEIW